MVSNRTAGTSMDGKVCVITGGAGSIGLATAQLFLEQGAKVMLVDLMEASLREATDGLDPKNVAYVAADAITAAPPGGADESM